MNSLIKYTSLSGWFIFASIALLKSGYYTFLPILLATALLSFFFIEKKEFWALYLLVAHYVLKNLFIGYELFFYFFLLFSFLALYLYFAPKFSLKNLLVFFLFVGVVLFSHVGLELYLFELSLFYPFVDREHFSLFATILLLGILHFILFLMINFTNLHHFKKD